MVELELEKGETIRIRVIISGRVQGVFFRAETRRKALELGVSGWVRNVPDGTVEAVFEGDEQAVQRALNWCREGPPGARVSSVEVFKEKPRGERGFRIVY